MRCLCTSASVSFLDSVSGQKLQLAVKYLFTHRLSAFILLLKESQVTKSCLESPYCALQLAPKKLHWVSDLGGQATMFSELLQLKLLPRNISGIKCAI